VITSRTVTIFGGALLALSLVGCDKLLHKKADAGVVVDVPDVDVPAIVDAGLEAAAATDPTAADATAPTVTASASATHAGVAPGSIPVGAFGGQVREGSISPYTMTLALTATGGSVSYGLPFSCKGTWTLTTHDTKSFHYKEHIIDQGTGRKCAQGENAVLEEVKPGTTYNYSEGSAHAALVKH
jgi:hypothetical protein